MIGQLLRLTLRGLRDMALHPWAQVFTLAAVTLVTLLAGLFLMLVHNVNQELLRNRGQVQFQVYWKASAPEASVEKQWAELRKLDGLTDMDTYTPKRALSDLAGALGDAGDFGWLEGQNPLPYSAVLSFAMSPDRLAEGWSLAILARLKNMDHVDKVHFNPMQMDMAKGWITLTKTVIWPIIGFLALIVALVVSNTIRLSLLTRLDEVEILALVGARPWYIRWPLLTGGAVQGLLGSGLALAGLKLVQGALRDALNFPPLFLRIEFLPWSQAAVLCAVVTLVGVASSFVAVRR